MSEKTCKNCDFNDIKCIDKEYCKVHNYSGWQPKVKEEKSCFNCGNKECWRRGFANRKGCNGGGFGKKWEAVKETTKKEKKSCEIRAEVDFCYVDNRKHYYVICWIGKYCYHTSYTSNNGNQNMTKEEAEEIAKRINAPETNLKKAFENIEQKGKNGERNRIIGIVDEMIEDLNNRKIHDDIEYETGYEMALKELKSRIEGGK